MKSVNTLTKKNSRKAQLTVFIILGLIILIITGSLIYISGKSAEEKQEAGQKQTTTQIVKSDSIRSHIQGCVENSLKNGIIQLGKQGGYFYENQPGNIYKGISLPKTNENIAYLIYDGKNRLLLPHLSEKELGAYMENQIKSCVNFNIPEFSAFEIVGGQISAAVSLKQISISAAVDYPVIIKSKSTGLTTQLSKFSAEENVRLSKINEICDKIITKALEVQDTELILRYVNTLLSEQNLQDQMTFTNETKGNDEIFTLTDGSSIISNNPFIFRFARLKTQA